MTLTKGVGRSKMTPDKVDGFTKVINWHSEIVGYVNRRGLVKWNRQPGPYHYIDTHCGDGDNGRYGPGSPVIFLEAMRRLRMDYRAFFIDREQANTTALRKRIGDDPKVRIYESDNRNVIDEILDEIPNNGLGMLYMDPNGCPDVHLLEKASKKRRRLDILVRANTTAMKRSPTGNRFSDIPRLVEKGYWLIRRHDPCDRWRWTFLLGSNYQLNDWKRERFHKVTSHEGAQIMISLDCTRREIEALNRQQRLFDEAVRDRSGGLCEVCRSSPATEKHHLRYGPVLDPKKVVHVCHDCHARLEGLAP